MANVKPSMDYDPYNPLPLRDEDDAFERLLDVETASMVAEDYDQVDNAGALRNWASLVISKYSMCENFDAFIPYLALNYFDRFISRFPIPNVKNDVIHDIELLALCCLTLAWKMKDRNFRISDLQERQRDLANLRTSQIKAMELHILKGLDWNLRIVTPFCFVPYIATKSLSPHGFNLRSINEIIIQIQSQNGLSITKRKPSVIAASALVAASDFLYSPLHETFLHRLIEDGIIKEDHEKELVLIMIGLCMVLKLVIESDVIEEELAPPSRLRVQAPNTHILVALRVQAPYTHILVAAEEPPNEMGFPIKWRLAKKYGKAFVIFSTGFQLAWPEGPDAAAEASQLVRMALREALLKLYKAELCRRKAKMLDRYCRCCEVL